MGQQTVNDLAEKHAFTLDLIEKSLVGALAGAFHQNRLL